MQFTAVNSGGLELDNNPALKSDTVVVNITIINAFAMNICIAPLGEVIIVVVVFIIDDSFVIYAIVNYKLPPMLTIAVVWIQKDLN